MYIKSTTHNNESKIETNALKCKVAMKIMTYKASQFVHALQDPDERKKNIKKSIQITYKLDEAMQNNNNRHIPW